MAYPEDDSVVQVVERFIKFASQAEFDHWLSLWMMLKVRVVKRLRESSEYPCDGEAAVY